MTESEIIQATANYAAAAVGERLREMDPHPAGENAARLRWLTSTLDTYRAAPDGAPARRLVDWLIQSSRQAAERSREGKRLHNLTVLRYIVNPRPKQENIMDALGLETRGRYRAAERAALERLAVLAFGIDGVQWKE